MSQIVASLAKTVERQTLSILRICGTDSLSKTGTFFIASMNALSADSIFAPIFVRISFIALIGSSVQMRCRTRQLRCIYMVCKPLQ